MKIMENENFSTRVEEVYKHISVGYLISYTHVTGEGKTMHTFSVSVNAFPLNFR
jgi:hypothetical protein